MIKILTEIKPIETHYSGYRFRSRLEARWAVFFDTVGIKWEYEKEGYDLGKVGYYLPDFWLPEVGFWAEVKPIEFTSDETDKLKKLAEITESPALFLIGIPETKSYRGIMPFTIDFELDDEDYIFVSQKHQLFYILSPDCYEPSDYELIKYQKIIFPEFDFIIQKSNHVEFNKSLKLYSIGDNFKGVEKAVNASKSARFEHGENSKSNLNYNGGKLQWGQHNKYCKDCYFFERFEDGQKYGQCVSNDRIESEGLMNSGNRAIVDEYYFCHTFYLGNTSKYATPKLKYDMDKRIY